MTIKNEDSERSADKTQYWGALVVIAIILIGLSIEYRTSIRSFLSDFVNQYKEYSIADKWINDNKHIVIQPFSSKERQVLLPTDHNHNRLQFISLNTDYLFNPPSSVKVRIGKQVDFRSYVKQELKTNYSKRYYRIVIFLILFGFAVVVCFISISESISKYFKKSQLRRVIVITIMVTSLFVPFLFLFLSVDDPETDISLSKVSRLEFYIDNATSEPWIIYVADKFYVVNSLSHLGFTISKEQLNISFFAPRSGKKEIVALSFPEGGKYNYYIYNIAGANNYVTDTMIYKN